jgi:hypothetical protein
VDTRDVRIDFFRGLALYMILVDHVIADPIRGFTYQRYGFSDAAEIFVFLSGVSCGIVYHRILMRNGWLGLMTKITRRTVLIYIYYLLSSIAVILLLAAAARSIKHSGAIDQSMLLLREKPYSTIRSTIFLRSPPELPGILVLYLEFTLVVIPLFLIAAARSPTLALVASGLIWTFSQIYPDLAADACLRAGPRAVTGRHPKTLNESSRSLPSALGAHIASIGWMRPPLWQRLRRRCR